MNWPRVPLAVLTQRLGGGTPSRSVAEYWGEGIPWFTVADLSDELRVQSLSCSRESISEQGLVHSAAQRVPAGAVVISTRVVVGKVGVAASELATNQDFCSLVPRNARVLDSRFLAYYFLSIRKALRHQQRGLTISGIPTQVLDALSVALPPLSEQRRIVEILDQADRLRCLRVAADAAADRILPALFIRMFGDPVTNSKGFDVLALGDPRIGVLDRGRSRHRPRNDSSLLGGPHPLIQTGDVARCDGRIRAYSQTYSDLGLSQSKLWQAGTLCITIAANIAKTGVLEFDACFPDSVVGFRPGENATTEYIQFFLSFLQPVLERNAPQAAQKNINLEILRDLPCPLPPRELQDNFSTAVREHYTARRCQIESRDRLEALFVNLGMQAINGTLTASWREAHMKELTQELEQQVRDLAEVAS